ncbi:foldase protein PrsA [Nautilia profundicola AmH]|uniref:peptidylprolyl isomerase n=1 Tax=Nautilia profundicola (strain ATCC BAA-1463 / DSM 18972 / AmH) TaxID=598659 RepID=B9L8T5_NAUPA|nr:peptidylprolyl isomerase [Nautilia profundicola]ACM92673.1 foldase protein PrsA [Nautilia profundicola AmH]
MKKIVLGGLIAAAAFAFPGMQGGMGNASMTGKPMKGLTDNTVVATIDGKKVTVKDVNNFLQGMTADNRIRLQDLPAQHVGQFVKQYVDTMVLYKKAKSVEKTPQFQALVKKMAVDYWLKQKLNNMKISDAEVKKFYEENKDIYFKTTPKVKARHIVVKDEKTAEKLINELKGLHGKALEEKFAELAKKYSTGPTKVNGGELGWFDPKQMVQPFAEAVNKMKPGELTLKPVKTRFGYHVILVEEKNEKNYMPLNEVKLQIIEYLKRAKLQKEIQKLKDSSKVDIKVK